MIVLIENAANEIGKEYYDIVDMVIMYGNKKYFRRSYSILCSLDEKQIETFEAQFTIKYNSDI